MPERQRGMRGKYKVTFKFAFISAINGEQRT